MMPGPEPPTPRACGCVLVIDVPGPAKGMALMGVVSAERISGVRAVAQCALHTAAPDMLAALRRVLPLVREDYLSHPYHTVSRCLLADVEAAIARAEGREVAP